MRATSLAANNILAINREIDSKYDAVLAVRDKLPEIELVAGINFEEILAELEAAQDFTGITVVQGVTVDWDPVGKILTVPKGDQGIQGIQGVQGVQGIQGERGFNGVQGTKGDKGDQGADGPRGFNGTDGAQGEKGDTGDNLTVSQIVYNNDGTFTWLFSDGTSYITPSLIGPKGDTGDQGIKGDTGIGVHHLKGTSTTQLEGDFGVAGETDTYTFYADAGETIPLGWFIVTNGISTAGDMQKSVYDTNNSGVVDNAEKVNGLTVQTAVPTGAVFTDTIYTHPDTHPASMITESTTKRFVSDTEKTIWNAKQEPLVNTENLKSVNGTSLLGSGNLEITAGSGGYSANIYLTSLVSSTVGSYNQISYTPDVAESTISAIVNANEVLMADYIFDGDVVTTSIPAGEWTFHYHSRVSSTAATSFIRFELFKRSSIGVETVLFSVTSVSIENTAYAQSILTVTQPAFATALTDRIGIKVYASTTRTNNTTIDMLVGDGSSSYFSTPLQIRHNQTRDRSATDAHPIGSITGLQSALDSKIEKPVTSTANMVTKFIDNIGNVGNSNLYSNAGGDLGLGVSPSIWHGSVRALETASGAMFNKNGTMFSMIQNAYYSVGGSYFYKTTGFASMYHQEGGNHIWSLAPTRTAATTTTFVEAMKLDTNGVLTVGGVAVATATDIGAINAALDTINGVVI